MTRIELEIHDDVISTLNKIKNINDSGVELVIPEGSILFDNALNLKIIEKELDKRQMGVQFLTEDEKGNNLIDMLDEKRSATFIEDTPTNETTEEEETSSIAFAPSKKMSLPKIDIKIPEIKVGAAAVLIAIPIIILVGYIVAGNTLPKANAKIVVNSVPLTRSVTVKVGAETQTDAENKTLKGSKVSTTIEETMETPTTGEKITGSKAKGEVTVYNKTEDDITLKKGTVISKDDLKFTLDETITIDGKTEQPDPDQPGKQIYELGEETVNVTAENYGEEYNLKDDTDFSIKGYKSSELTANNDEKFTGGKTQRTKIVSADDQKGLSAKLTNQITQNAINELTKKLGTSQKLINGSLTVKVTSEVFSNKVNDATEKLTLTQKATVEGLTYSTADLDNLMDKVVESLVPQGYVISEKDKQIEVNALGGNNVVTVTPNEADIQVTLKTYIVTDITEESVRNSIAGKNTKEAKQYFDSLQEIKTYEFKIAPVLPLFNNVPKNSSRIHVAIEKQ